MSKQPKLVPPPHPFDELRDVAITVVGLAEQIAGVAELHSGALNASSDLANARRVAGALASLARVLVDRTHATMQALDRAEAF
jgi:hypothetical protein